MKVAQPFVCFILVVFDDFLKNCICICAGIGRDPLLFQFVTSEKYFHHHIFLIAFILFVCLASRKKNISNEIITVYKYEYLLFVGFEPNHMEVLDIKSTLIIPFYFAEKNTENYSTSSYASLFIHHPNKCWNWFSNLCIQFLAKKICFRWMQ